MTKRPKPSKRRIGGPRDEWGSTLEHLQLAVDEYCQEAFLWRWGKPLTEIDRASVRIDPAAAKQAHAQAQKQRGRARALFKSMSEGATEVINLSKQGLVSEEAAEHAREICRSADCYLAGIEIEPSRHDWLRMRVAKHWAPNLDDIDLEDLAVLSLVAGWWPELRPRAYIEEHDDA
ncbi:MAG TPA: hypothetical protein VK524_19745, partial [Polyangiaceae bacterium]|nr:hypothetical protein [Polyangiaceae bacterium]